MDKLITTANEYPFTSFCVFLGLYILGSLVIKIAEVIFLKSKN